MSRTERGFVFTGSELLIPVPEHLQRPLYAETEVTATTGERQTGVQVTDSGKLFKLYRLQGDSHKEVYLFQEHAPSNPGVTPAIRPEGWSILITTRTGHPTLVPRKIPPQTKAYLTYRVSAQEEM